MNYYFLIITIIIVIILIVFFFTKKFIEKCAFLPQFTGKYDSGNIEGFSWINGVPTITINPENNKYTDKIILYSHGNAENIGDILTTITKLSNYLGISIFLYDYPGYGSPHNNSAGTSTEKGCYENIKLCYNYLCEKYRPENIIIMGRSIGTGPSTYLAANYPIGLLVLISPFKSVVSVVSDKLTFLGDIFPNEKNIKKVKAPVVIIHGINDSIIPISHSVHLWSLVPNKLHFQETNNDHNDILDDFKKFNIGINKFLEYKKI